MARWILTAQPNEYFTLSIREFIDLYNIIKELSILLYQSLGLCNNNNRFTIDCLSTGLQSIIPPPILKSVTTYEDIEQAVIDDSAIDVHELIVSVIYTLYSLLLIICILLYPSSQ